jgi:uncharacterized protein YbjT (DUF2867 family)
MILVTGGTGLNGKELLRRLSASGIAARALVRNPAKAEAIAALPMLRSCKATWRAPKRLRRRCTMSTARC